MRRLVPPLIVTAVILAVAVPTTCNRGAIARAKADAARLTSQRDSLLSVVGERERQQAALTIQRQTHEADITRLRDSAIALERRRAAAQLTVRQIRTVGALQDQLRAAAYQTGYQTAFTSYQDLSKRHIAELSKPRIGLGSALRLLGAMGLGVVVGRALP
ncbi:MAG: hypothetical protein HYW52_03340 [Gemmatimonadetes bacterium]|nr:hypothetical protein [Gemmatimonadota bacterium]